MICNITIIPEYNCEMTTIINGRAIEIYNAIKDQPLDIKFEVQSVPLMESYAIATPLFVQDVTDLVAQTIEKASSEAISLKEIPKTNSVRGFKN